MNRARTNRKIVKGWKGLLVLAGALLLVTAATGCEELAAVSGALDANAVQNTGLGEVYDGLTGRGIVVVKGIILGRGIVVQ